MVKIEARQQDNSGSTWAENLIKIAYHDWGVKPFRRLKVLVNPVGGPGKAPQVLESRVKPILEAAGCKLDIEFTKYKNHGIEIAEKLNIQDYDALVCLSGDGMLHEVLNGYAKRKDFKQALSSCPVAPIPAGSGNAMAINLLGAQNGFSLSLACLNVIKGKPLRLDVCTVTQPCDPEPRPIGGNGPLEPSATTFQPRGYRQYYSFLSQAVGLMADVDLGTEDMRSLGDARFIIGYIGGVLRNQVCEVDIDVKMGPKGGTNKAIMRERTRKSHKEAFQQEEVKQETSEPWKAQSLEHGSVIDALPDNLPDAPYVDPSWPFSVAYKPEAVESLEAPSEGWTRFRLPISSFYAGKNPYVSRDLLQFPYALPGDGVIDLALTLHGGGRLGKLRAISGAESGQVVYDRSLAYLKVQAYRVTPRLAFGDKKLKKGGLISIDGERVDWKPFQVEISKDLRFHILSLFGTFSTPDVRPPPSPNHHHNSVDPQ